MANPETNKTQADIVGEPDTREAMLGFLTRIVDRHPGAELNDQAILAALQDAFVAGVCRGVSHTCAAVRATLQNAELGR